jgi:hypothetical protein
LQSGDKLQIKSVHRWIAVNYSLLSKVIGVLGFVQSSTFLSLTEVIGKCVSIHKNTVLLNVIKQNFVF